MTNKIISYKGLDSNLKCRDFQFEVGKTYTHTGVVKACESGFHACENPWDVLSYYNIADSRFCVVEQSGDLQRHGDDSKIASASITISAELKLPDFVKSCVDWLLKTCSVGTEAASGDGSLVMGSYGSRAKAAQNGAIALAWWDGTRPRIAVGYVGEELKADTWYRLDDKGNFVEVE